MLNSAHHRQTTVNCLEIDLLLDALAAHVTWGTLSCFRTRYLLFEAHRAWIFGLKLFGHHVPENPIMRVFRTHGALMSSFWTFTKLRIEFPWHSFRFPVENWRNAVKNDYICFGVYKISGRTSSERTSISRFSDGFWLGYLEESNLSCTKWSGAWKSSRGSSIDHRNHLRDRLDATIRKTRLNF